MAGALNHIAGQHVVICTSEGLLVSRGHPLKTGDLHLYLKVSPELNRNISSSLIPIIVLPFCNFPGLLFTHGLHEK